jgi:predicted 3-demethylubiquinone-9 3-methyltransferase (glyoxalase superfamily)
VDDIEPAIPKFELDPPLPTKEYTKMQKISPFLWFDDQAEEAVKFYTVIFKNSKIAKTLRYGEEASRVSKSGSAPGSILTIEFELEGQKFTALNGGPQFRFNESISFVVNCDTQEEVDYFWAKLTADGGQESACGWLKDKFGVSWQIVPTVLIEMLQDKDSEKSERVMKVMLQMQKLDIKKLNAAYAGK